MVVSNELFICFFVFKEDYKLKRTMKLFLSVTLSFFLAMNVYSQNLSFNDDIKTCNIMELIKFKGQPVNLAGKFVTVGASAPDFELVKTDLTSLSLADLKGKKVVLNIFPSLDTGVCATSVRRFNVLAAGLPNSVVLAISKDLPFAHARFCTVEGIDNVIPLSDFRTSDFGVNYGVLMADGPLRGLLARAVIVINEEGEIIYTELVPEITQEPDYDEAIKAVKK